MRRKSYLFDLGNSSVGPIGLVVRVMASSRSEAVDVAREALRAATGPSGEIEIRLPAEAREKRQLRHRVCECRGGDGSKHIGGGLMIHTVRWQPNDRLRFVGRNGTGQCTGIELFHNAGIVFVRPFTGKNVVANCEIAVPVTALSELTTALETLHRIHKIKPFRRPKQKEHPLTRTNDQSTSTRRN